MKDVSTIAGIACVLVIGCTTAGVGGSGNAVSVNGQWITDKQVNEIADALRQQLVALDPTQVDRIDEAALRKEAAQKLIGNRLLIEDATKKGIVPGDSAVTAGFTAFSKSIGEENIKKDLARTGHSEAELKRQFKERMILDSLVRVLTAKTPVVTDTECAMFYRKNQQYFRVPGRISARQIMIMVKPAAPKEERERARRVIEDCLAQILKGGDFAALARRYSQDPNAKGGGDLGWFSRGDLVREIDSAAFGLVLNQISGIVVSPLGYHIIQKTDEEQPRTASFETVKENIRMQQTIQRKSEKVQEYLETLMARAKIVWADTAYAPVKKK